MEPGHDSPNGLRYDSPPGLKRMSSIFRRIMRKDDAPSPSGYRDRDAASPQWKQSLQREAGEADSTPGHRIRSWIRSSSNVSVTSSGDWRRGSGSSKSSYSSIFSKGRYSYGSTTISAATSARRSSALSSTARLRRSGNFSVSALAKSYTANDPAPCESIRSGKDPREELESLLAPCPCSHSGCHHVPMNTRMPLGPINLGSSLGGSGPSVDHTFNSPRTSPTIYHELQFRPHRLSNDAEMGRGQSHLQVTLPMHESLRDTVSWTASSSKSTHATEYDSTTASEYEDDLSEEVHVLAPWIGVFIDKLLEYFYVNNSARLSAPRTRHHIGHGSSESSSTRSSQGGRSGEALSPRGYRVRHRGPTGSRDNEAHDSGGEEEGEDRPSKRLRSTPGETVPQPLLACPFCKWKPLSYQHCYRYVLKDISRVKQHLRRNHRKPPYCPKCCLAFSNEESRDLHVREETCQPQEVKLPEGITAAQAGQLERRVDKKLSKADQWYSMYSILFPGCPLPSSPYVDSDLSSELQSFQQFMGGVGLELVEQTAHEHIPPNLMPHHDQLVEFSHILFQHAVPRILQRYECTRPNADRASDSGYGSGSARSGGRPSREIELPAAPPPPQHGPRSAQFIPGEHDMLFPPAVVIGAASSSTGRGRGRGQELFTAFPPSIPTDEPLTDFDMDQFSLSSGMGFHGPMGGSPLDNQTGFSP